MWLMFYVVQCHEPCVLCVTLCVPCGKVFEPQSLQRFTKDTRKTDNDAGGDINGFDGFYASFLLQKAQILGGRNVFLSCYVVILGESNVIFILTDMNFLFHFRFYLDRITFDVIQCSFPLVHS